MQQDRLTPAMHLQTCKLNDMLMFASHLFSITLLIFIPFKAIAEPNNTNDQVVIPSRFINATTDVTHWKAIRDAKIVKQDLDYSCGAASLATILREFYKYEITEAELLKYMVKEDARASFSDMTIALQKIGFVGIGYAASFDQLVKLNIPVVIYMKHRKNDHFSVLRGISEHTVWLSDPSLGNITVSKHQFQKMWETRKGNTLKGKILAILPADRSLSETGNFFTKTPKRQSSLAVQLQAIRHF